MPYLGLLNKDEVPLHRYRPERQLSVQLAVKECQ